MSTVTALNLIDADHLDGVIAEMRTLGAPTIRAVETTNGLVAIEGSHRLAAAAHLGIQPVVTVIEQDEMVDGRSLNDIRTDVWANCDCDGTNSLDFAVSGHALAAFVADAQGARYAV